MFRRIGGPGRVLAEPDHASGRQPRFGEAPALQLSPVRQIAAFRSESGPHLLRWFAGEEPQGDRGGLGADGLEAVHVAADQSESEQAREYRIHGRAGCGSHLPGNVGRPECLAGAVSHHGKEQDDRISGQIGHLLEKLRQRETGELVEM